MGQPDRKGSQARRVRWDHKDQLECRDSQGYPARKEYKVSRGRRVRLGRQEWLAQLVHKDLKALPGHRGQQVQMGLWDPLALKAYMDWQVQQDLKASLVLPELLACPDHLGQLVHQALLA